MTDYKRRALALRRPKVKAANLGRALAGVRAEKASDDVEKVYIYAPIGGWFGVDAQYFAEMLSEVTASTIELHLNSPGGDAFDGIAIANLLRQHDATVNVVVDGLAASAASIIAMAGDDIAMAPGSQLMIHRAWALCIGNSQDMAKFAGELDHMDKQLAKQYAARAGGDVDAWLELMSEETWYDDEEAVAAGLADRLLGSSGDDDGESEELAAAAAWDLSIFAHAGRADAPAPRFLTAQRSTKPAASAAGSKKNTARKETDVAFTDDQVETLRQMVGVSADADFDTFQGALAEALEERADGSAAATLPDGTVAIEKGTLEDLQAKAALGVQAREQQLAEHRASVVSAAVRDGRIPPTRAEHWVAQLKADPGAEQVLAGLAKGVVNVVEIGHADAATTQEGSETDVVFAAMYPEDVEKEGA